MIKTHALANLNFSKSDKIQYGLKLESDQFLIPLPSKSVSMQNSRMRQYNGVQTAAYLNYKLTRLQPHCNINRISGADNARVFNVGAKASKFFFGRKHSLTTSLSLNWSNKTPSLWSQFDRSLGTVGNLNSNKFDPPRPTIGRNPNWEINSNWSLSTGLSALIS